VSADSGTFVVLYFEMGESVTMFPQVWTNHC